MIVYRVLRSDGQVVLGPYLAEDSCSFKIDIPAAGTYDYDVQMKYDGATADSTIEEIHMSGMVIKR